MKRFDVLVVGELNVDLILGPLDRLPVLEKEILAKEMVLTLGSSSAIFASNLSALGNGAASRAGSVVWFVWLAFVALHLLRVASDERQMTAPAAAPRRS